MRRCDKVGGAASVASIGISVMVLSNTSNGRMAQGGVLFQFIATVMFIYAGVRGSRWWFTAPLVVVIFWVVAAHIGSLWN
jgi:hypothetical protein